MPDNATECQTSLQPPICHSCVLTNKKSNSKATLSSSLKAANKLDKKEEENQNTGKDSDDEPLINLKTTTSKSSTTTSKLPSKCKSEEITSPSPSPSPSKCKKQYFETITDPDNELERYMNWDPETDKLLF